MVKNVELDGDNRRNDDEEALDKLIKDVPQPSKEQKLLHDIIGLHTLKGYFLFDKKEELKNLPKAKGLESVEQYMVIDKDEEPVPGVTVFKTQHFVIIVKETTVDPKFKRTEGDYPVETAFTMYVEPRPECSNRLKIVDTIELAIFQHWFIREKKAKVTAVVDVEHVGVSPGFGNPMEIVRLTNDNRFEEWMAFGHLMLDYQVGETTPFTPDNAQGMIETLGSVRAAQGHSLHMCKNIPATQHTEAIPAIVDALQKAKQKMQMIMS